MTICSSSVLCRREEVNPNGSFHSNDSDDSEEADDLTKRLWRLKDIGTIYVVIELKVVKVA